MLLEKDMAEANPELEQFLDDELVPTALEGANASVVRELLLFEHAGERYALAASAVDAVVPWREPTRVPGAEQRVLGVIQDRGRVVVLLAHPTGQAASHVAGKRIVICGTKRGYVGVPATTTNAVASTELRSEPTALSIHDSRFGPFTFLEAERWVQEHHE
jgi:chemotaxis signal transduction protein